MRLHRLILSLLLFAVLGEGVGYAAPKNPNTQNSQSTQKKLTPAQKKREAAKRKAAKQKAAKAKAAKKKRIKDGKPLLYVYSYDLRSGERLPATHITIQDILAKPNKRPKLNKPTDTKRARVSKGLPVGKYWLQAAKIGYFATDTIYFDHREDEDSVVVALYPETRITFTVTDSLTLRPVSANIVVRNPERHKVMQTTSDSLHSTIAVLLDDRVPYYTIEATASDYFPFNDTILVSNGFDGVVMRPRIIRSLVLHNIYFAAGKTRILSSSEPALIELYQFLSSRPDRRIRIIGHTDDIGTDRSNQVLSEGRCQEVRRSMIDRGIRADRIEIEGRGERDPIVPNTSEENRQMNRRVEIVLL